MKKHKLTRNLWTNVKKNHVFKPGFLLLTLILFGCATTPDIPWTPPTITINTIPAGADISIQGNYIGSSPISIPTPATRVDKGAYYATEYRADAPLQIEAQLTGYVTKTVSFGLYTAQEDEVHQSIIYGSATKTKSGYYTFPSQITIKLSPSSK